MRNALSFLTLLASTRAFQSQMTAMDQVEAKVLQAMADQQDKTMPLSKPPMDDYRFTKLVLSPGRQLYGTIKNFKFRPFFGAEDKILVADKDQNRTCVDHIVCHMDAYYRNIIFWQHYVLLAFPCWSLFQRYPNATHYVDLNFTRATTGKPWEPWIQQLHDYLRKGGVRFLPPGKYLKRKGPGKHFEYVPHKDVIVQNLLPSSGRGCAWIARAPRTADSQPGNRKDGYQTSVDGNGWADPEGQEPLHNFKYFMQKGDIFRFQQLVLEGKFRSGPSMDRPRLLVLDRNDMVGRPPGHYTGNRTTTQVHRNWNFSNATFERIQKVWGQDIDVRLIPSFRGYTFGQQAEVMHNHDIIVSPHGAQLTNGVFVRPCTAVLELFARRYYYPKKGPLIMEAGGIAYDGYHFDGSPVSETPAFTKAGGLEGKRAADKRKKLRTVSIRTSPGSILWALPEILHEVISCRKKWMLRESAATGAIE